MVLLILAAAGTYFLDYRPLTMTGPAREACIAKGLALACTTAAAAPAVLAVI